MTRDTAAAATAAHAVDSFRPEFAAHRPDFRTPSPPTDAFEPLSPPSWPLSHHQPSLPARKRRKVQNNHADPRLFSDSVFPTATPSQRLPKDLPPANYTSIGSSHSSPTALDVFAAVATSPSLSQGPISPAPADLPFQPHTNSAKINNSVRNSNHHHRRRSEHKPSNSRAPKHSKSFSSFAEFAAPPTDGYAAESRNPRPPAIRPAQDITVEDAELLLNFSRTVTDRRHWWPRNATDPSPAAAHSRHSYNPPQYPYAPTQSSYTVAGVQSVPRQDPGPEPQKKPRVHKGWPKGKPRGKRVANANQQPKKPAVKKTGKPGRPPQRAKQARAAKEQLLQASVLPSLSEPNLPPRPKSALARSSGPDFSFAPATPAATRSSSVPIDVPMIAVSKRLPKSSARNEPKISICGICSSSTTPNGYHELWIICNGCKKWSHTICAGFKTEREVRDVDKFYCPTCEPEHGKTTFVRKSARAHAAVDYAGLNEGQLRAPPDSFEHHFIKPIKEGTISLLPEKFPRMPPELVTAEFFEKSGTIAEPIVIPASLNPRPWASASNDEADAEAADDHSSPTTGRHEDKHARMNTAQATNFDEFDYDCVADDGQDLLDMVMPPGLTVRRVAEVLGPERPIQVIETKSQDSGGGPWTLAKWADYYEATGEKPVRNVISLEVSQTKLSRLVRRPKVVRDLDLTDQVWPAEELGAGSYPYVQYYCLMSVADCFTDFHIDFGGSSVFYHILRGKKTFFFIPPKKQHLKKYEDWCVSPNQASIWLGDVTKECYRVDLFPGDTMLIPSGWIHAVWTPETSLVIGGNFLTRMHYSMQLQVNEIEKNTQVAKMFRYPYFQRVMWYAVVQYLQEDPVPAAVAQTLWKGEVFDRQTPIYLEHVNNFEEGSDYYNARYYSQGEVDGFGDLLAFVFRTIMIAIGKIPLARPKQEAVIRSLPSGYGDHLDLLKLFALWVAWKRGNEKLPSWAHMHAPLSELDVAMAEKKPGLPVGNPKSTDAQRRPGPGRKRKVVAEAPIVQNNEPEAIASDYEPQFLKPDWCQICKIDRQYCCHNTGMDHPPTVYQHFGIRHIVQKPSVSPIDADVSITQTLPHANASSDNSPTSMGGDIGSQTEQRTPTFGPLDGNAMLNMAQARIKACEECRKSKRRCVHDAAGNIDPVKAMQNPVPRAFSAAKRVRLERPGNGQYSSKKFKMDPTEEDSWSMTQHTAGLVPINFDNDSVFPLKDRDSKNFEAQHNPGVIVSKVLDPGSSRVSDAINGSAQKTLQADSPSKKPAESVPDAPTDLDVLVSADTTNSDATDVLMQPPTAPGSHIEGQIAIKGPDGPLELSESEIRSRTPSLLLPTTSTESVDRSMSPSTSLPTDLDHSSPTQVQKFDKPSDNATPGNDGFPRLETDESDTGKAAETAIHSVKTATTQTPHVTPKSERSTSIKSDTKTLRNHVRDTLATLDDPSANEIATANDTDAVETLSKINVSSPMEELEEDESLRLARQLQEQEFSLRRRRGSR